MKQLCSGLMFLVAVPSVSCADATQEGDGYEPKFQSELQPLVDDLDQVNQACGIEHFGFDVQFTHSLRDLGLPDKSMPVTYFAYEEFSERQADCVGSTIGDNGFQFVVTAFSDDA